MFARHLEGIVQAVDTDVPGQLRTGLGHGRKQGGQVVDAVDVVLFHNIGYLSRIGYVYDFRGSAFQQFAFRSRIGNIAAHHMAVAIYAA